MGAVELTTMTSRGQIVIPQGVREALALGAGAKFMVMGDRDTIILKRLEVPSPAEVKALLAETRNAARRAHLKQKVVKKIVAEERKRG